MYPIYSLLVSDLDGTLLTSSKKVSGTVKASIAHFRDCGGRFTVATGRSLMECKVYLDELHVDEPVIINNGASIYLPDENEILALYMLPYSLLETLLKEICALPIRVDILLHSSTSIYIRRMRTSTREDLNSYGGIRYRIFPPGLKLREPIFKLQMLGTVEEISHLKKWAKNHPLAELAEFVQVGDEWFEILPLHASKGTALKIVMDMLNIPAKKTAAIGDNCNDISMLSEVSLAAVVGNAHPLAKKHATHFVPSNDKDGIATLIKHYLLVRTKKGN
jgi:Cof subfamily protein (haloacid dehalogenase superfamily)